MIYFICLIYRQNKIDNSLNYHDNSANIDMSKDDLYEQKVNKILVFSIIDKVPVV